ncbi:hypothetical protein QYF36_026687 [Acer negundo]|nr:hypothetical protein QYF36_026687 [Acer negundo]
MKIAFLRFSDYYRLSPLAKEYFGEGVPMPTKAKDGHKGLISCMVGAKVVPLAKGMPSRMHSVKGSPLGVRAPSPGALEKSPLHQVP